MNHCRQELSLSRYNPEGSEPYVIIITLKLYLKLDFSFSLSRVNCELKKVKLKR